MRSTSTFVIAGIILLTGLSIGAWRAWRPGYQPTGGISGAVNLPMITTESKRDWIMDQVFLFNYTHPAYHITFKYIESRKAMQSILYHTQEPVLWSPDSPGVVSALAKNWNKESATPILETDNPESFRIFQRSPIVFLTTRDKAAFLKPILGGSAPWEGLRKLSLGQTTAPWGAVRFSHADPSNDATGMLTLGLILNEYTRTRGTGANLEAVANSDAFGSYLAQVDKGMAATPESKNGTYALTTAYVAHPDSLDFIVTTENAALQAAAANPQLAVIYPNPTAVTEESLCIVNGPWVSPAQRQGAQLFLDSLGQDQAEKDGIKLCLRPADETAASTLSPRLAQFGGQGFCATYAAVDPPSYAVLNSALYQWRKDVAHTTQPISL